MAFCGQCGKQINDGATFCPHCGKQQPPTSTAQQSGMPPVGQAGYPPVQPPAYGTRPAQTSAYGTRPGVPPAATGAYGSATIGGAGISVANIVLVIMAGLLVVGVLFAKWSTSPLLADYGSWFGAGATSFTLFGEFDLVNQMTDLMGTAGSLASSFGVSADVFDAFSLVKVVLFLVVAAVVVACLLLVIGGVFLFMRKTTAHIFCALGALALFVITGLHSLILMFANASIADELASASWGLLGDVSIIAPTGLIWLLTLLAIGTAVFAFLQMGKSKA